MWRRRASQYPLPNKCWTNVKPIRSLREIKVWCLSRVVISGRRMVVLLYNVYSVMRYIGPVNTPPLTRPRPAALERCQVNPLNTLHGIYLTPHIIHSIIICTKYSVFFSGKTWMASIVKILCSISLARN